MKEFSRRLAVVLSFFLGLDTVIAVPPLIQLQGRLTDANGINRTGNYALEASIFDAPAGGGLLWKKTFNNPPVSVRNGNFRLELESDDSSLAIQNALSSDQAYMELRVLSGPGITGPESPMVPRQRLTSNAFVFKAGKADRLSPGAVAEGSLQVTNYLTLPSITANRALSTDGSKNVAASAVTSTELDYLSGATSNIQIQLNNKAQASRLISAGTGLSGGGDLSADRTISLNLGNANAWTALQSFGSGASFPGSGVWTVSGNVGIGTSNPAQKLEVAGAIKASGGYVQPGSGGEALRMIRGAINANNTPKYGSGFTMGAKGGTGVYNVNFITAFSAAPVCMAIRGPTTAPLPAAIHISATPTTSSCQITLMKTDDPSNTDGDFMFIVVGPP
ncbi:MAG: hypothetical protein HY401_09795 [Elusimicrobia bacterium]|nr:hypothetical protein [Elusimicrobiota bacterium]